LVGGGRILLQKLAQLFVHYGRDDALNLRIIEPDFGLGLELGLGDLDADDGRQAFAKIFADRLQVILEHVFLGAIRVQGAVQGSAETTQMRAAGRVEGVVGVAAHPLFVGGGVLQGDFHPNFVHHFFNVNRLVNGFLGAVEILHELGQAAVV